MTIFVSGVHAVGKTYLAKPACEALGFRYATASQLIREERGLSSWNANKVVNDIEQNQAALVAAVQRIKQSGLTLVLDGHFVLRKAAGIHERLPESVFHDLGCTGTILLSAPLQVIDERLIARGDTSWTADELLSFAAAEKQHAETISAALAIPLHVMETPSLANFQQTIDRLSKR
ncbi:MAG: hypothetical protein A2Z93_02770 [Curvibacter sp. GWA2_64_110]|nr:MAG: hypothetical protein A2Z93_02770 [Curvibacter sp. GWA2_64_110]HCY15045.1 hypothetical protein [Curvibacter sp.]